MSDPYRTMALIESDEKPKNTFKFILLNSADEFRSCPVCGEYRYWAYKVFGTQICSEFKRVTVRGFLWWRKKCPISGTHTHKKCKCGAVVIEPRGYGKVSAVTI